MARSRWDGWASMVKVVPPGERGTAKVDHVEVSEHDAAMASIRGEFLSAGPLARLLVNGHLMMSDGDMEHRTNGRAAFSSHGDVLVAGLGLGMILVPMLRRPEVKTVTVLELNADVIALVEPHVRGYVGKHSRKLTVIQADCFAWAKSTSRKFDCIYFDIWPTICTDNLKEIARLKRAYQHRVNRQNPDAWMAAWVEELLRGKRREARRYEYESNFRCGTFREGIRP